MVVYGMSQLPEICKAEMDPPKLQGDPLVSGRPAIHSLDRASCSLFRVGAVERTGWGGEPLANTVGSVGGEVLRRHVAVLQE